MAEHENAGTESPESETPEVENGGDSHTSEQTTPSAPDPSEVVSSLDPDELRSIPSIKKLLDDQAAAIKAKYKPKAKPKAKQEPKTAQPEANAFDPGDLLEQFKSMVDETVSPLAERLEQLTSARETDQFESDYASHGMPDSVKDLVKLAYDHEKPRDKGKFFEKMRKKLGVEKPQPGAESSQQQEQPKGRKSPGIPTNGSDRDLTGPIDPFTLNTEQVAKLREEGRLTEVMDKWRQRNNPRRVGLGRRNGSG